MKAEIPVREHAREQARALVERLGRQAAKAAEASGPDAVHDLRVAIRRFGQCLRVFAPFFPARRRKRVRRRLRCMMDLAGEVRNRDLALELVAGAGVPPRSAVVRRLTVERREAERAIRAALARWQRRNIPHRWRAQLEL